MTRGYLLRSNETPTSPIAWQHINFQGEFNFDDDSSLDPLEVSLADILAYEPEGVKSS